MTCDVVTDVSPLLGTRSIKEKTTGSGVGVRGPEHRWNTLLIWKQKEIQKTGNEIL